MDSMLDYVSPIHLWKIITVAFFGTSVFWVFVLMICVTDTDASEFQKEEDELKETDPHDYFSVEDRLRALEGWKKDKEKENRTRYIR